VPIVGERIRDLPAPPTAVFADLVEPNRQPSRHWLVLLGDETLPTVLDAEEFTRVRWSSLWHRRPDAVLDIELTGSGGGTAVHRTLIADDPAPDVSLNGHMRKRVNELLFAHLRYSYGA